MKDDIRIALESGLEMTARELSERIQPESIQRLHEALSSMKKAGEIENGNDRMPGEPGGLSGKGARPSKTYRLADIDKSGALIERRHQETVEANLDISGAKSHNTGELGFFSKTTTAAIGGEPLGAWAEQADTERAKEESLRAAYPDVADTFDRIGALENPSDVGAEEWAPDAARSAPPAPDYDEDSLAILIHGHEEMMLTYADDQLDGDKLWSLMRQQYQALQEL